jgi:C1A family cysteine protease
MWSTLKFLGIVSDGEESVIVEHPGRMYGWKRDAPDHRDRFHDFPIARGTTPGRWDLRTHCPPVKDQGNLATGTVNAVTTVFQFALLRQALGDFDPSRHFLYWNMREVEGGDGDVDRDCGGSIRDALFSLFWMGCCTEKMWPYDSNNVNERPSDICFSTARYPRSIEYKRVEQTLDQLRAAIRRTLPVIFGFSVYESFEAVSVAADGKMPEPTESEQLLGGHAGVLVGYDDEKECGIVRNSWGSEWGDGGDFYMPYAFLLNPDRCGDFWTLEKVTPRCKQRKRNKRAQVCSELKK